MTQISGKEEKVDFQIILGHRIL